MSFSSTGSQFDLFELWLITDSQSEARWASSMFSRPGRGEVPTFLHADWDTTANSLFSLCAWLHLNMTVISWIKSLYVFGLLMNSASLNIGLHLKLSM